MQTGTPASNRRTDQLNTQKKNHRVQEGSLLDEICHVLEEHKARDIVVIDLNGKSDIADHMVIATGDSRRQVAAMGEKLSAVAKARGIKGLRPEGKEQADWILLDAGEVVVHLFRPEVREFYSLEKMWNAEFPETHEPATA